MIEKKIKDTVLDYAAKIVAEGMNGKGDRIAMRTKNGFCVNDAKVALDVLKEENLIEMPRLSYVRSREQKRRYRRCLTI